MQIEFNKGIQSGNLIQIIYNGARENRIIQNLSFAFDWWIGGGSVIPFHLTNITIHAINGFILFNIIQSVNNDKLTKWMITLLFLIHPLQVQSVVYIMGRISLLQTLFFMLGIYLFKNTKTYIAPISLTILGFWAKESCVGIPLTIFIFEYFFLDLKMERIFFWLKITGYSLLGIGLMYFLINPNPGHAQVVGWGNSLYPFWKYLWMQFYFIWFQIFLFFNSSMQSIIHYPVESFGKLIWGAGIFSFLIIFFILRKRWNKNLTGLVLIFLLTNTPQLIIQFINPFAEYRLYQSNLIISILFSCALTYCIKRNSLFKFLAAGFLIYFASFNIIYQLNWNNPHKLYYEASINYPDSAWAYFDVGIYHFDKKQYEEAETNFQMSLTKMKNESYQNYDKPLLLLSVISAVKGNYNKSLDFLSRVQRSNLNISREKEYYSQLIALNCKEIPKHSLCLEKP